MKIYIDFEAFYDRKQKYDLRSISMVEYIRNPKFKAFGAGIAINDSPVSWIRDKDIDYLNDMVDWSNADLICQNTKFDASILLWRFGCMPRSYIDTMGMSRAVLGKTIKRHALKELSLYFGLTEKGELKTDGLKELTGEQEKELSEYCLHDVELTREIFKRLEKDFPINQYPIMDQAIRMFVEPRLQLNVPLLEKANKEEMRRREKIFEEIGIEKKEFASNKKFPDLLRAKGFEVPVKISSRTGKEIPALALGDPQFLELKDSENEELKRFCEARIAAKSTLLETRTAKLASIGATGKWPFDVEFSGADQTHRFSGGSGAGGNPQNFTRGSVLREAIEAPEGYSLVVGDFSNIEFRILAYLAKDPGLIQAIESGIDIYCDFGSVFYGRKITKQDIIERRFGKTAILGLGYGMGWEKFIKTVRVQTGQTLTEKESRKAIDLYRTRYNRVPMLWERFDGAIEAIADSSKLSAAFYNTPLRFDQQAIILPSGLKIRFPNLRQEVGERSQLEWVYDVYNKGTLEKRKLYGAKVAENIVQGLAGEICKEAMIKMGNSVVGQVHDELIILVKKGLEQVTAQKLKRAMSISPSWMSELKLDAEIGWGKNWRIAK